MSLSRDNPQIFPGELGAQFFKKVHTPTVLQSFAECKRQQFAADGRQTVLVDRDYRQVVSDNLAVLLLARGKKPDTIKAYYPSGPRAGKRISERTIRYILAQAKGEAEAPTPGLDVLAGLAKALDVPVHILLLPGYDPVRPPVLWSDEDAKTAREIALAYAKLLGQHGELPEDDVQPPETRSTPSRLRTHRAPAGSDAPKHPRAAKRQ